MYRKLFQSALAKERRDQKLQVQREQESHSHRSGLSSTARINDPMAELSVQSSVDTSGPSQRQKVDLEVIIAALFLRSLSSQDNSYNNFWRKLLLGPLCWFFF